MSKIYIGEKYAPSLEGDWDSTRPYERLSIVSYDNKGYISRIDVPIGTNILDSTYWMYLYGSSGGGGSLDWADIIDKPTTFPPSDHTQDWNTILNPPVDYPPSAHTHDIDDVLTLTGELNNLKVDIANLKNSVRSGVENSTRFTQSNTIGDVVNSTIVIPWNGTGATNGTGGAYFRNEGGKFHIVDPDGAAKQYDVYCSAMFTINSIGPDTSFERTLTISNFTTQQATRYKLVPGSSPPPYVMVIPQFYVGAAVSNPVFTMSASVKLSAYDEGGGNALENFFMLRAVRK